MGAVAVRVRLYRRRMTRVKTFRFGPGSLESITVSVWTAPGSNSQRVKGRAEGSYRVYCGMGNEHTVEIKEEFSGWAGEASRDADVALLFACRDGNADAAATLAGNAVEYALVDWFDPCDVDDDIAL